jgi:hypothetical protein
MTSLALGALGALASACGSSSTAPGGTVVVPGGKDPVVDPVAASCGAGGGAPAPGSRVTLGTQGPWAVENCVYGGASGIQEGWIVGVTTDEAQNRWIATPRALYLATPGGAFRRYDELDGLHLGAVTGRTPGPVGWAKYCDMVPIADGAPCAPGLELLWGGATATGIRSVAGGGPNEVFVGYHGGHTPGIACDGGPDWCDPLRHSGKIDRVRLNRDGSITVDRFDFWINNQLGYWHNRTPFRMLYDHVFHPGTLYAAMDHGIVMIFPDRYTPYPSALGKAGLDAWLDDFVGDHLHAEVCVYPPGQGCNPRAGDWRGLALDAQGRLWQAGQYTAGLATWDPDPLRWHDWNRPEMFVESFGWKYVFGNGYEPVFKVPQEGDSVHLTATSVCPDGTVWFGSAGATAVTETVAQWSPATRSFRAFDARTLGLGERAVEDLVCLADGRLVIAGQTAGAVVYDPATGASAPLRGLPGRKVVRLELDTMVSPPSLLVATDAGAAVLREIP